MTPSHKFRQTGARPNIDHINAVAHRGPAGEGRSGAHSRNPLPPRRSLRRKSGPDRLWPFTRITFGWDQVWPSRLKPEVELLIFHFSFGAFGALTSKA